ncbi:MAG: cell division protein FtsX [Methylococcales symbiont of Hymedesmia sp. n. MRB-2018]|nr:MAG: cell division protein FtsX [Methylococcales symbiont of Hymedesmia sp. n. MRB-2018]KAF3982943.1 MAG: cell division protein FtsX [Methylococcales symbiont of Hymedesmia sp. n. MRB-2018]
MKNKVHSRHHRQSSGFSDKSQAYLHIHLHALFSSLGRLCRNSFTSLMTIVVMAIAISLASGFYLLLANMQQLTANIEASNQISLFLKSGVSDRAGEQLVQQIRKNTQLDKVVLISKKQALKEFKDYSGFGNALDVLEINPLPVVIQILPKNTLNDLQSLEQLLIELEQLAQVDFSQMDMQWVERLQSIMQIMQRGAILLSGLLSLAVLFITGNTIRLELQNRQDEVQIAKLVGATHSFIQRPFLYTGFWLGFIAGIMACLLVALMIMMIQNPIENLSILYDGAFNLLFLNLTETLVLLAMTSLLGILGAWGVLHYQLQQIKPE